MERLRQVQGLSAGVQVYGLYSIIILYVTSNLANWELHANTLAQQTRIVRF